MLSGMLLVGPLRSHLAPDGLGQGFDNARAAVELLLGVLGQAEEELHVRENHPFRRTLLGHTAIKLEGRANAKHDAALEVGLQPLHEHTLLGRTKGHPDEVHLSLLNLPRNGRIVKIVNVTER